MNTDSLPLDNPFWQFSLGVWQQPGIESMLINLQDQAGCSVNLLLLACWSGSRQCLIAPHFNSSKALCDRRDQAYIHPLRQVRRACAQESAYKELKGPCLKLELQMEQHLQAELFELARDWPRSTRPAIECVLENLKACSADSPGQTSDIRATLDKECYARLAQASLPELSQAEIDHHIETHT